MRFLLVVPLVACTFRGGGLPVVSDDLAATAARDMSAVDLAVDLMPLLDLAGADLSPLGLGGSCAHDTDCASGHCVDGYCCNTTCTGTCMSCALAGTLGQCMPIAAGDDPANECPTTVCMDGTCDGNGACRPKTAGTTCGTPSCSAAMQTNQVCDGLGTCGTAMVPCAPYACGNAGVCLTSCTGNDGCSGGAICDLATHSCGKLGLGAACVNNTDCQSGHCGNGLCCTNDCMGACKTCANQSHTCANLSANTRVADCVPATPTPCGNTGYCDGNGQCAKVAAGHVCVNPTCDASGNKVDYSTCDGNGACHATSTDCHNYACATVFGYSFCYQNCWTSSQCSGGHMCSGGVCQ